MVWLALRPVLHTWSRRAFPAIERLKQIAGAHLSNAVSSQVFNNELAGGKGSCSGSVPVVDPSLQRGFWAVLPGGNLSVLGAYLQVCWLRGGAAAAACSCLIFSAQELVAGGGGV